MITFTMGTIVFLLVGIAVLFPFYAKWFFLSNPDPHHPKKHAPHKYYLATQLFPRAAKIVRRGEEILWVLMPPGYRLKNGYDVISDSDAKSVYHNWFDGYLALFGMRFVGFFFPRLLRYEFPRQIYHPIIDTEKAIQIDPQKIIEQYAWKTDESEFVFLGTQQFKIILSSIESGKGENVKVFIEANLELEIINLEKSVVKNPNWFISLHNAIHGKALGYGRENSFDALLGKRDNQSVEDARNAIKEGLAKELYTVNENVQDGSAENEGSRVRWGVNVIGIMINNVDLQDKDVEESRTSIYRAEQAKRVTIVGAEASARAKLIDTRAEAARRTALEVAEGKGKAAQIKEIDQALSAAKARTEVVRLAELNTIEAVGTEGKNMVITGIGGGESSSGSATQTALLSRILRELERPRKA